MTKKYQQCKTCAKDKYACSYREVVIDEDAACPGFEIDKQEQLMICPESSKCSFFGSNPHCTQHPKNQECTERLIDCECPACIPYEPATCPDCGCGVKEHDETGCHRLKQRGELGVICSCRRTPADLQPEKQAKPFERYDKYEVMKLSDIEKYLMQKQKDELGDIIHTIQEGRRRDGKILCNSYVVVKEGLPYTEQVWKLIEDYETKPQPATCPDCGGNGISNWNKCSYCNGTGKSPADLPEKHCPNCNGTGILAYCDLCSGTGEKPPTREDFRYMEGLGKQPEGEGFVENLDLQPEKHCTKCGHLTHLGSCYHVSYIGGRPESCGCFIEAKEQPTPTMPLIERDIKRLVKHYWRFQRTKELEWRYQDDEFIESIEQYFTAHDSEVAKQAVKEFAEKVCKDLEASYNNLTPVAKVLSRELAAHIREMAEGKE